MTVPFIESLGLVENVTLPVQHMRCMPGLIQLQGGKCAIEYGGSCSVKDTFQREYTCVGGKCGSGTGSTSMICVRNSDCTSGSG